MKITSLTVYEMALIGECATRAALRAYHDSPDGFKDLSKGARKRATDAVEFALMDLFDELEASHTNSGGETD